MRDFKELLIWQRGHQLTLKVYMASRGFPKEGMFGLKSQIRRSSSSVPTNIAEGCGHNSNSQLKYFFTVATGSCSELEYQLLLARDLEYINNEIYKTLSGELIQIRKMIAAFTKKLPI